MLCFGAGRLEKELSARRRAAGSPGSSGVPAPPQRPAGRPVQLPSCTWLPSQDFEEVAFLPLGKHLDVVPNAQWGHGRGRRKHQLRFYVTASGTRDKRSVSDLRVAGATADRAGEAVPAYFSK